MQEQKEREAPAFGYKRIFEPLQIKKVTLRNRIVFPAVATNYATPDGFVTQGLISYHERIAEHVGLDITELAVVRPKGDLMVRQVHMYDDIYIRGLAKLAESIKKKGAAALVQLCELGARAGSFGAVAEPVAPSRITLGPIEARELSVNGIREMVVAFGEAARRGFEAGFDGVELHGAHMYLISQFLSPFSNRRTDRYGGCVENRATFLVEIIEAIKKRVPEDFLISCRINGFEPFEGGIEMEDVVRTAQILEQTGIDILNLSGVCQRLTMKYEGKKFDWFTSTCPRDWPEGHEIKYAMKVNDAVKIPLVTVGKIFSPQLAENVLELKQADLVAMARALIADPELPRKMREGRDDAILRCREDFRCLKSLGERKPMACVVNKSLPPENIDIPA